MAFFKVIAVKTSNLISITLHLKSGLLQKKLEQIIETARVTFLRVHQATQGRVKDEILKLGKI
jgi:hypothetical protein